MSLDQGEVLRYRQEHVSQRSDAADRPDEEPESLEAVDRHQQVDTTNTRS